MKIKTIIEPRKSVALKVVGDTLVIKKPPHVSDSVVEDFIKKKQPWINKQRQLNQVFEIDQDMVLFSKPIRLTYLIDSKQSITMFEDRWLVSCRNKEAGINQVKQQLKLLLSHKINERLKELNKIKAFKVKEVKIKNLTSTWGKCSQDGQLSFAFRLVHMKESFVDSVIAHEVAHLFEMNHSPAFYRELSQFDPNYRSSIKDLLDQ